MEIIIEDQTFGAQSFTSSILHLDSVKIHKQLIEHFHQEIVRLQTFDMTTQLRRVTNTNIFSELKYQCLNGALPSRK